MKALQTQRSKSSKPNAKPAESLPLFCDYTCPHATFAPPETSGACRREAAVFCTILGRYNNKNAACIARKQQNG